MKIFRFILAGAAILATSLSMAAILLVILEGWLPICTALFGRCFANDFLLELVAIASIGGIVSIVLTVSRAHLGSAAGAGLAFLGAVGVIAVGGLARFAAPPVYIDNSSDDALSAMDNRLIRASRTAQSRTIESDDLEVEIPLTHQGVEAIRFELSAEQAGRYRIDVIGPDDTDPLLDLFVEEEDGGRTRVVRDDDGGDGNNAKVELELAEGAYLLLVIDRQYSPIAGLKKFKIKVSRTELGSSVEAQNRLPLSVGGPVIERKGVAGRDVGKSRYILTLDRRGRDVCLAADASWVNEGPVGSDGVGDTVLFALDSNLDLIANSDDWRRTDKSARLALVIGENEADRDQLILDVRAWGEGTEYVLNVRLLPAEAGECPELSALFEF